MFSVFEVKLDGSDCIVKTMCPQPKNLLQDAWFFQNLACVCCHLTKLVSKNADLKHSFVQNIFNYKIISPKGVAKLDYQFYLLSGYMLALIDYIDSCGDKLVDGGGLDICIELGGDNLEVENINVNSILCSALEQHKRIFVVLTISSYILYSSLGPLPDINIILGGYDVLYSYLEREMIDASYNHKKQKTLAADSLFANGDKLPGVGAIVAKLQHVM